MSFMKEKILQRREQDWLKKRTLLEKRYSLQEEKKAFYEQYRPPKKTTNKKLITFLFINCTVIEIFTLWITIKSMYLAADAMMTPDFSPLVTLVGAAVSEVIGYAIYAAKSMKENTEGGIVYMQAQNELNAAPPEEVIDDNDPMYQDI